MARVTAADCELANELAKLYYKGDKLEEPSVREVARDLVAVPIVLPGDIRPFKFQYGGDEKRGGESVRAERPVRPAADVTKA